MTRMENISNSSSSSDSRTSDDAAASPNRHESCSWDVAVGREHPRTKPSTFPIIRKMASKLGKRHDRHRLSKRSRTFSVPDNKGDWRISDSDEGSGKPFPWKNKRDPIPMPIFVRSLSESWAMRTRKVSNRSASSKSPHKKLSISEHKGQNYTVSAHSETSSQQHNTDEGQVPQDDLWLNKMNIILKKKLRGVSIGEFYDICWSEGKDTQHPPLYGPWLASRGGNFDVDVGDWKYSDGTTHEHGEFVDDTSGEQYTQQRVSSFHSVIYSSPYCLRRTKMPTFQFFIICCRSY